MDYEKYDDINYYLIIFFSLIFILLYIIYLSVVIMYILKYYHTKKLCIFWVDYCCLIFTGILFIFIYNINLILNNKDRIDNPLALSKNFYSNAIILSLTSMCLTIIGSLLLDSITALTISSKINDIKKINEMDIFALSQRFKKIKFNNILRMNYAYKYYILFIIIYLVYMILCFLTYRETNEDRFDGIFNLHYYFDYLLRYYHLIVFVLLIISLIAMNMNKASLLKKNYYNPNRIAQKVYEMHFNQIIYFTDVLSFKLASNLIMSNPCFFFLSLGKYNSFTLILSEAAIFLFIFIGGSENIIIDRDSKIGKLDKKIEFYFCIKKLDFHFGEKDNKAIFNEIMDCEEDENIITDLSTSIIKNIEHIFIDFNDDEGDGSILGIKSYKNSKFDNVKRIPQQEKKILDFKRISEFYLVQKLIMIYFITNKKIYESANNSNDEIYLQFKKVGQERKNKRISLNYNKQIKDNILSISDRKSTNSIKDIGVLKSSMKLEQNEIFTSIEEKELLEDLKKKLNIKNEKFECYLNSLSSSELIKLFPFFQMNIGAILKSLNPSRNLKVFNKFVERNNNAKNNFIIENIDNRISIKSLVNRKNSIEQKKDEKEIEKNLYYTHDLYLMYEIYDIENFPNISEIEKIMSEYNKYLIKTAKNMNYSFLPLILGIFNIKIYDTNKIIVLYRNPLYFTNFNHFNHWINFYITEEPEKIKVSSLFNDVIDVNEIEIKNTLKLSESDYEEIKKNIKNDYSFLKKIKNIFPIIHLFIGDENNLEKIDRSSLKIKRNNNQFFENSILGDLSIENNTLGLVDILDNNYFFSNANDFVENIDFEENSLFDKEYFCSNENTFWIIKIYFTSLFRKDCKMNQIEGNINDKVSTEIYCEYLQDQLINYLNKDSLFSDEENDNNNNEQSKDDF